MDRRLFACNLFLTRSYANFTLCDGKVSAERCPHGKQEVIPQAVRAEVRVSARRLRHLWFARERGGSDRWFVGEASFLRAFLGCMPSWRERNHDQSSSCSRQAKDGSTVVGRPDKRWPSSLVSVARLSDDSTSNALIGKIASVLGLIAFKRA